MNKQAHHQNLVNQAAIHTLLHPHSTYIGRMTDDVSAKFWVACSSHLPVDCLQLMDNTIPLWHLISFLPSLIWALPEKLGCTKLSEVSCEISHTLPAFCAKENAVAPSLLSSAFGGTSLLGWREVCSSNLVHLSLEWILQILPSSISQRKEAHNCQIWSLAHTHRKWPQQLEVYELHSPWHKCNTCCSSCDPDIYFCLHHHETLDQIFWCLVLYSPSTVAGLDGDSHACFQQRRPE